MIKHYFHPRFPRVVIDQMVSDARFDGDGFADAYLRLGKSPTNEKITTKKWPKRARMVMYATYYFWLVYALAAVYLALIAPLILPPALAISPFLAAGLMYVLVTTTAVLLPKLPSPEVAEKPLVKLPQKRHTKKRKKAKK